ncbi:MAG: META domain-containing protein [Phycisphaerales bacterium]|nr:META domain-containing protein [Hyphomonadaceae bacterium]
MRALAGALFALSLAACATSAPPPGNVHLAGTSWLRVDDLDANPHGATMSFTAEGASGETGCNRWFSAVTQNGEALRFGNIGTTRRACLTGMQADTERNLLQALRATRYAHYDQDALVLLDEQQTVIARFNAQ